MGGPIESHCGALFCAKDAYASKVGQFYPPGFKSSGWSSNEREAANDSLFVIIKKKKNLPIVSDTRFLLLS